MNKHKNLDKVFLFISVIIVVYLIICNIRMSHSLTMNVCLTVFAILSFLMHLDIKYPINLSERGPSFKRIFLRVAFIMCYGFFIITITFLVMCKKNYINEYSNPDYIIVFGCGIKENKQNLINSRLENAVKYAKEYPKVKFVLTGAKGADEPIAEAIYMRDYMNERGIQNERLLIDTVSINTYENIENSLALIENELKNTEDKNVNHKVICLMSSDFHLTRIMLMAKKLGIDSSLIISCETEKIDLPYLYIRECLSLVKALVLGQVGLL